MNDHEIQRTGSPQALGFRSLIVAALLVIMLALPAFAAAQGPTKSQYDRADVALDQRANSAGSGEAGSAAGLGGNVGPLPFTGFDVIAMAAVALAVTGVGLALQRAVARESSN